MFLNLLRLQATSTEWPRTTLPEIALLAVGKKPAVRLVLDEVTAASLEGIVENFGLAAASKSVGIVAEGSWGRLVGPDEPGLTCIRTLMAVAPDRVLADEVVRAESAGEGELAGRLLGYPLCCVDAFRHLCESSLSQWAQTLLARSGSPALPCWANRLAIGWGGTCPAGELYPCRLDCPSACLLGREALQALSSIGLQRLADAFLQQSLTPLAVSWNGEVRRLGPRDSIPEGWQRVDFIS